MRPPIDVDRAGLLDLARIKRLNTIYCLNQPEHALTRSQSVLSPLGIAATWSAVRPTVLIGRDQSGIVGFAEFRPVLPDLRWQLFVLGLKSDAGNPHHIWTSILEEGTRAAGAEGVKRLYARAPEGTHIDDALRATGYAPYASELVFVSEAPAPLSDGEDIREQERADTWAVHQLYNSSVPKEVLYAEAYTSHRWELPKRSTRFGKETRAWLVERNQTPVAYARCVSFQHRHVLDVIFAPGHLEEMAGLLDSVFARLKDQNGAAEVYCSVRSYGMELERILLERSFRPWMSQRLFVRYTAASIRVATAEVVFSEGDSVERAPRRVPVYLAGVDGER